MFFLSSGIGQQRWHLPAAVIGNPRLLQEWPDVPALLSQRGGDCEQSAAADGALAGLDAMADLALNHRLAQCNPLQPGLKGLADRPAALLQGGPVDRSLLVVVPVGKKLLLQAQQFCAECDVLVIQKNSYI